MNKRKFKLPGVDDLNKGQDRVLRLPEDGQFLIVGGPGTGKSVVALLRTLKYIENDDYIFLTYNKILLSSTLQLVKTNLKSRTLTSLIYDAYYKQFKQMTPEVKKFKPDYEKIINDFETLDKDPISLHLIIDEGQDMPPKFYEALMYLGIENFFIVADQNQQITEDNSTSKELENILGLELECIKYNDKDECENKICINKDKDEDGLGPRDYIELKENYRNSHPIALLSHQFYTDPSSPPPKLPSKSRASLGTPTLYEYTHYHECVKLILREADRDPRNLIGVVVTTNDMRDSYVQALNTMEINLDNPRPIISTYFSGNGEPNIDFSYGGIVVLNDKSIKGLEFDVVFVIIDGFQIYNNDLDSMKKRFYVMSSRAIKKLVFLKNETYTGGVEKILPKDENILVRKRLNNG